MFPLKTYLSFKLLHELSNFCIKPVGNAIKYDESLREGA